MAVNQLIERKIKPASSVWELLQRDFDLSWAGVNTHFLLGMFGFSFLIGCRVYIHAGRGLLGKAAAGISLSGLLLMISIVNRAVASGSGDGLRYGSTIVDLVVHYVSLLVKQATRPMSIGYLELGAMGILIFSLVQAVRALFQEKKSNDIAS